MNASQIESAITSVIIAIGGFLVGKGWLTTDQVTAVATGMTTIVGVLFILVPIIRKLYTETITHKIETINATDGVKVVSQSVQAPMVTKAPSN